MKKTITQSQFQTASTFAADLMTNERAKELIQAQLKVLVVSYFTGHKKEVIQQLESIFSNLYIDAVPEGFSDVGIEKLKARQKQARRTLTTQFNHVLASACQGDIIAIVDNTGYKANSKDAFKMSMGTTANQSGRKIKVKIEKVIPVVSEGTITPAELQSDAADANDNAAGSGNATTSQDDMNTAALSEHANGLALAQSVEAFQLFVDSLDSATKEEYKNIMLASIRKDKREAKKLTSETVSFLDQESNASLDLELVTAQ